MKKYITLMKLHPDLFRNDDEPGAIKIIKNQTRILEEQAKIRKKLESEGKPTCWIDIGILSEDQWFYVVRDMVEFPDGKVGGYIRFINRKSHEGGFNVILLCRRHDRILMIKRFRHEHRDWSWEFPRGFGEAGLSAEENAAKELVEEIGVIPSQLIQLANVPESSGGTAVFCAEIPDSKKIKTDEGEGIADYRWVSIAKLEQLIVQGQLTDWFSLWAYSLAKIKKKL